MKKNGAEMNWWSALSSWLVKYQGRADYLFIYDGKRGQLDRCFERNVSLSSVDEATISRLYQAAAEGRLGLLRPKDLKPQLLTADPEKMFSSGKEVYVEQNRMPAEPEREPVTQQESVSREESAGDKGEPEAEQNLDVRNLERAVADPAVAERLRAAEELYRKVVYAPREPMPTAPTGVTSGENSAAKESADYDAALGRAVEAVRNAMPLQLDDGFGREQEQLIAALAQMVLSLSETGEPQKERLEQERKAREELAVAQNLFIWAAASDKRDQAVFEAKMEWLDDQQEKLAAEMERLDREWKRGMEDMSRELHDMDLAGASEGECKEKIRDYLDGKRPAKQHKSAEQEDGRQESEASSEMWGNALRHFCRFAASEVPLSVRHVQVAKHCQKILREAAERDLGADELGLNPQEMEAVKGTIEMGKLVQRGLLAQEKLTSGHQFFGKEYRACLRNFLAMKGIEEALVPHVQAHEAEIGAGDGPISAMQILMAHQGFRADDLRDKTERTSTLNQLERMNRQQVARMIRQGGGELAALGQQVMVAYYQMNCVPQAGPQHIPQPKAPQVGGPQR